MEFEYKPLAELKAEFDALPECEQSELWNDWNLAVFDSGQDSDDHIYARVFKLR